MTGLLRRRALALVALLGVLVVAGLTAASAASLTVTARGAFAYSETRCTTAPLPARYADGGFLGFYSAVEINVPASCVGKDLQVTAYSTSTGASRARNVGGTPVRATAAGWTRVPLDATYPTLDIFLAPTRFALTVDSWGMEVTQPR